MTFSLEIEKFNSMVIQIRKRRVDFNIAMPYDPRNGIGDDLRSSLSSSGVDNPYNAPSIHVVCAVVRVLLAERPNSLLLLRLVDQQMLLDCKRCERWEGKLQGRSSIEMRCSQPEMANCRSGSSDISVAGVIKAG